MTQSKKAKSSYAKHIKKLKSKLSEKERRQVKKEVQKLDKDKRMVKTKWGVIIPSKIIEQFDGNEEKILNWIIEGMPEWPTPSDYGKTDNPVELKDMIETYRLHRYSPEFRLKNESHYKAARQALCDICSTYPKLNCMTIPSAKDATNPTVQDFIDLEERAKEFQVELTRGKAGDKKQKQRITLKDFIKDYCDLSKRPDIDSKCEMLLREHRAKRIKLPLVRVKYRKGQRYLFYLDKLIKNWPTYRTTLTTLPLLKKSGNK